MGNFSLLNRDTPTEIIKEYTIRLDTIEPQNIEMSEDATVLSAIKSSANDKEIVVCVKETIDKLKKRKTRSFLVLTSFDFLPTQLQKGRGRYISSVSHGIYNAHVFEV